MSSKSLRLREAVPEDERTLLEWANDPGVRSGSFNTDPIDAATHADWYREKLSSADAASWARRCPEYLGNLELPGGHFFIFDERTAITIDFNRHLSRLYRSPAIAG